MRSVQTEQFSRFYRRRMPATLNWPRQSIGGRWRWVPKYRDGSDVEFILLLHVQHVKHLFGLYSNRVLVFHSSILSELRDCDIVTNVTAIKSAMSLGRPAKYHGCSASPEMAHVLHGSQQCCTISRNVGNLFDLSFLCNKAGLWRESPSYVVETSFVSNVC